MKCLLLTSVQRLLISIFSDSIPTYVINLDLPPEQRWTELMSDKKNEANELLEAIKNLTEPFFHGWLFRLVDRYGSRLAATLPYPFYSELKGISNATDISLGEVTLYNLFYEVFTVCTSIIAQDDAGKLFHARNLDFGLFMGWDVHKHTWLVTEILRKLIVQLDFQRNQTTVFKSVNFAGYVGMLTGIKPNRFTLTMNERFGFIGGYVGIAEWIFGFRSGSWMGFLTRQVLENATSYEESLRMLTKTKLLAPAYFILGGNKTGQGSIITRGLRSADILTLGRGSAKWYLLETNYDHWKTPPFFDDRRTPAKKCLNDIGSQNITLAGIFNVLSTVPVLNKLTVYTALMQADNGTMEVYMQNCGGTCWPW